jgi:hypothetical protein
MYTFSIPYFLRIANVFAAKHGDDAGKSSHIPSPTCGICGDAFKDTYSALALSSSANSSSSSPIGLHLPCPNQHSYCVICLSRYISCKLDPHGTGGAPEEQIVFPIRCPECPPDQWFYSIQDDVAERILPKDKMALWVSNVYVLFGISLTASRAVLSETIG